MSTPDRELPARIDYKALVEDDRIHASLYTDPRIFADEMERIFHRGWVFVGHASEIPRPGDYVTRRIGVQPVIMVRGRDGDVSVLVNRCRHRGTMLCPAERGHARDLRVSLPRLDLRRRRRAARACPIRAATPRSTRARYGLDARAARVSSYRGFVFASLRGDRHHACSSTSAPRPG